MQKSGCNLMVKRWLRFGGKKMVAIRDVLPVPRGLSSTDPTPKNMAGLRRTSTKNREQRTPEALATVTNRFIYRNLSKSLLI